MLNGSDDTLFLEQVREIGVFAWHGEGYMFSDDKIFGLNIELSITSQVPRSPRVKQDIRITGASEYKYDLPDNCFYGWHHLSDCNCKYCEAHRVQSSSRPIAGT